MWRTYPVGLVEVPRVAPSEPPVLQVVQRASTPPIRLPSFVYLRLDHAVESVPLVVL